ncbi:expressed protein [Phakopsora pachyrhizi]|uniref:Expressed protein n=1 Tax=Phakopsora pachyrhizi TaxID=170000 RepID=A0AAV0BSL0_PHAPC|nr:expressed protein [Phakopsora pachyrhizi]
METTHFIRSDGKDALIYWENIRLHAVSILDYCDKFSVPEKFSHFNNKPIPSPMPPLTFPSLQFMRTRLECLNLSRTLHVQVAGMLKQAISAIDKALHESYQNLLPLMQAWAPPHASHSWSTNDYAVAVQNVLRGLRSDSVEKLWTSLLLNLPTILGATTGETKRPNACPWSMTPLHPRSTYKNGRPCVFSKEQTTVLRTLLSHDDRYSLDDKQLIATALNLTREQVNRWFCNARARKKPYQKMKAKKTVSSILSSAKSSPTFETSNQAQP